MTFNVDLTVTMGVIVTVVLAIVGWVQMGRKAMNDRITGLNGRLDRHEARITAIEQNLTNHPGKDDFHNLHLGMAEMKGEIALLNERLKPLSAITDRLQEWMLENGK